MQWKSIAALRIFLILSFLQRVCRGIDCYQCNSRQDEDCTVKSANAKYLRPCPSRYSYCRKYDSIYYFTDSPDYITIRECAMLKTDGNDCYRGRYSKDSYQRVCECEESGCNHSGNSAASVPKNVIFFLLVLLFFGT